MLEELQQREDFLKAVVQVQLRDQPSLLTDQQYRWIVTRFKTTTDQHREFLTSLIAKPDRTSFGAFCEMLRQLGLDNIADFLEKENTEQLPLSGSADRWNGQTASLQTPEVACAATPTQIHWHVTGAETVIYGSHNQVVKNTRLGRPGPQSRRFNFITPIVRELYGRDKELEEALDLLKDQESPVIILQGIVGIGKSSLGKKICKAYLQKAKDIYRDAPLCFMVQFTTDTLSSPEMVYKEIVIQMFGGEGLGYDGLDERGYLNLLTGFCRQLPANCILLMDDCENIIPTSSPKMIPVLTKALQKLMECSDNLKVVVVSSVDISSSLHDLPHQTFVLPALSLKAAVQVLERSEIRDLPGREKLQEIAEHSYCHPLLLGMALQLLPMLGADQFLREISHQASPQEDVKESEATVRLKQFFLRLQQANPSDFTEFLKVAIIPGKFFLDDWEPEGRTRRALQRRLLIEESQTEEGTTYWSVPPVLRQVAKEECEKKPEVNRQAKVRFANYCVKLMRRLSSRLYTGTRTMLREIDVQRANVQLLLTCVSDWGEDFKESPDLFSDVLQSLTYPGIGNILSLRFNLETRFKAFETLLAAASDISTTCNDTLAKVCLELCHITRVTYEGSYHQTSTKALEYAEKALRLFGGDNAPDGFKAQCLAVKGRVLAGSNSRDDNHTAVGTLQTARELCEKKRADAEKRDREAYLFYTELLSSVWKALGNVYAKTEYDRALECLQTAIEFRSQVSGPGHISQVVLLKESGKIQSKWASKIGDTEKAERATDNLKKAIAICKDYGFQGHHLYGITNFELGRTLTHCRMFSEALQALHEAHAVFENLGSECSFRLAEVCSSLAFCYKGMRKTEDEISWHQKCLGLLQETTLTSRERNLRQLTLRHLDAANKLLEDEQK